MAAQELWTTDVLLNPTFAGLYYYRGEDVNDSGGYFNTLTNNNSVAFSTGKFGNAFDFGSTDGNTKSMSTTTNYNTNSINYTISLWLNVTTDPGTNTSRQFFATGPASGFGIRMFYGDNAGTKRLNIKINTADNFHNVTLTPGTWYNIVIKGHGGATQAGTLWIDGTSVTGTTAGSSNENVNGMYIGNGIAGLVDDVMTFNGVQVSDANIGLIYNGGFSAAPANLLAIGKSTTSKDWTVPSGIAAVKMIGIGGAGRGGNRTATVGGTGGGGAGARATLNTLSVSVSDVLSLVAGVGSGADTTVIRGGTTYLSADSGTNGTDNSTTPGTGGLASNCVGDVNYDGGDGYTGTTGPGVGGGGGGAALDGANGTDATSQTGATGGDTYAGAGGNGGSLNTNGNAGGIYGGAGGGCQRNSGGNRTGGTGQNGVVWITQVIGPGGMKSFNDLLKASISSMNGLALASVKSWNGLA